ncbi:MAG TPA: NAD(P)-dependent oxidoreductase [Candidatus Acidoferrales bacterium]|nr:NAD(P)-dependent oxidoreductase [Candidatus Acidoferrales bacterium]
MKIKTIAQDRTKIGFIGIGAMGLRIAGRLLKQGFCVTAFDRNADKVNSLAKCGGIPAGSIAELASGVDVVMSSLPSDAAVMNVYTGREGVLENIREGSLIIEMSTVNPETSRELCRLGLDRRVKVLDVPVSGSTPAAEQGLLTLLGGGDQECFSAAKPIFAAISRQHFHLGPSGSGATMKLVVNTLLGVGMQAIAEAIVLGEKAGLNRQRLFDVLSKTAVIAPAHVGKLTKALKHDYRPEFAVGLMNKDFRLILETAFAVRAPMPTVRAAFPINDAEFANHPDYDFSAVIERMEAMANINPARIETPGETISRPKFQESAFNPDERP